MWVHIQLCCYCVLHIKNSSQCFFILNKKLLYTLLFKTLRMALWIFEGVVELSSHEEIISIKLYSVLPCNLKVLFHKSLCIHRVNYCMATQHEHKCSHL